MTAASLQSSCCARAQLAAQEVADPVDWLMPLVRLNIVRLNIVRLNTVERQNQPAIGFHRGAPRRIDAPLLRRTQQAAIGFEQLERFAA
jgi:hypothetical protein